eukprot:3763677-Rhodomonas_salina.6
MLQASLQRAKFPLAGQGQESLYLSTYDSDKTCDTQALLQRCEQAVHENLERSAALVCKEYAAGGSSWDAGSLAEALCQECWDPSRQAALVVPYTCRGLIFLGRASTVTVGSLLFSFRWDLDAPSNPQLEQERFLEDSSCEEYVIGQVSSCCDADLVLSKGPVPIDGEHVGGGGEE